MATSRVAVTEGSGKNLATHSFSEDAVTKEVSRVNLNTSAGVETGVAASPLQVSLANHGANATPVVVDLGANNDVTVTGTVDLGATDNAVLDTIAAKDFATQTTLAAINAKMVTGTDIGDVTINNASGASAVNIQDGGNTITVDGTVAVTNAGITTIAGAVAETEMQVDVVAALPAGTNAIGKLAANSGVDIGDVDVTSISAGTNLIGDVDIAPRTTGGWSVGNFNSGDTYTALTNSAQVIKGSAGKFGGYYIYNPNSSATYVMVYDIAAASVTVGTSTAKLVFCIPSTSGANLELLAGIPFSTAMSVAAATTGGGNSAPSTALEAMIFYK